MQLLRLSGRKQNEYVRRQGKVWRGKHMIIRFIMGAPRHPQVHADRKAVYVGTLASLKLDKLAVKRNRMRRRCRESLRREIRIVEQCPTVQLLVSPRSSSLQCPFTELMEDATSFFSSLS